jgi:hypothetical protein
MTREQREQIEAALNANTESAARLFASHPIERLGERASPASWSAIACIAHLNLTSAAMLPLMEAAIADLRARGATTTRASRMDWFGRVLRWSLEPGRFRMKTIASFEPPDVGPVSDVLSEFERHQTRALEALRAAEGLNLAGTKMTSPFDARARYNVMSAFRILDTHQRRHLAQAARAARAR